MKREKKTLFGIILAIYIMMVHNEAIKPKEVIEPIPEEEPYESPDPNREIYKYDWEAGIFIYKDEVEKPTFNPNDTITYYPDYHVKIINELPHKK